MRAILTDFELNHQVNYSQSVANWSCKQQRDQPYDANDNFRRVLGRTRPQRVQYRLVSVYGDSCQREDGHVNRQNLNEGAEGAHESREIPSLKNGGLELEGNGE